ncbi:MAG: IS982 family transposase [Holosporales bacterium]|nr:IS982 family transposase [Holosporales bacterium]
MTMEIVGEFLGFGSDKAIYEYFKNHWLAWFPRLGCRTTFTRQCANLSFIKEEFYKYLSNKYIKNDLLLFDGFPIPTCNPKRVRSKNPLYGEASFGYCAAKDKKYFGFKGNLLINQDGLIVNFEMTPANGDEQEALLDLAIPGTTVIADKGLLGNPLKEKLKEMNVEIQTPLRKNMKETRSKHFVYKIMNIRRKIETVIGQLTERFNIQRIRAKDTWHLLSKVRRKLCAHVFAFTLAGNTKFEKIIS